MRAYICPMCSHIEFNELPDRCPKCCADKQEFKQINNYLKISANISSELKLKR